MPKGKKVRVRMTGTTNWIIRPGDEISLDEKMAKRWERGKLATIIEPAEEEELTLAEMRKICGFNDLAIRGTKAEVKARILDSGVELKLPEEKLPFEPEAEELEMVEYEEEDLTGDPSIDEPLMKEFNPESD